MAYPDPTDEMARHYRERGWLTLDDAVDAAAVADLNRRCAPVLTDPGLAYDPSRIPGQELEDPDDPVLLSMLAMVWVEWQQAQFHRWTAAMAEKLAGVPVDFWYDQLLFKPPHGGAATYWHQDEAYLGAGDEDLLVSCWLTLSDVDVHSGCMHFYDRGHSVGIIPELLTKGYGKHDWDTDPERVISCPLRAGGVTFHHGKMPHMTYGNTSDSWRLAVIQRFAIRGVARPTSHSSW